MLLRCEQRIQPLVSRHQQVDFFVRNSLHSSAGPVTIEDEDNSKIAVRLNVLGFALHRRLQNWT